MHLPRISRQNIALRSFHRCYHLNVYKNGTRSSYENLATKCASIKFKFKYSKEKIEFLDTSLYKEKNDHLQTAL